jgi:anti-sigma B factor antagonist
VLEPFEVHHAVRDGRHTLVLRGELDIVSAGDLKDMLIEISRAGTVGLTLNLSELTFMDSTGLYMVLFAQELSALQGWDLSLIPGSPRIQHVFDVTGLVDVLPFHTDEVEAVGRTELGA